MSVGLRHIVVRWGDVVDLGSSVSSFRLAYRPGAVCPGSSGLRPAAKGMASFNLQFRDS